MCTDVAVKVLSNNMDTLLSAGEQITGLSILAMQMDRTNGAGVA